MSYDSHASKPGVSDDIGRGDFGRYNVVFNVNVLETQYLPYICKYNDNIVTFIGWPGVDFQTFTQRPMGHIRDNFFSELKGELQGQ